jgi:hypothetical protein
MMNVTIKAVCAMVLLCPTLITIARSFDSYTQTLLRVTGASVVLWCG